MHLVRNAMAGGLLRKGLMFVDHRDATLVGSALLVVAVLGESVVPARAVGICGNNNFIPVQDPGATGGINCVAPGQANQSSQSSQSNLGSIGVVVDGISQAAMSPVESELQSIRDQIQSGNPAAGRGPLGYATDPSDVQDALGYSSDKSAGAAASPIFLKAPPKPADPSGWAVWGQAFGDYETRSGSFDGASIARNTSTGGGIAGLDKTFTGLTSASDALVVGILANGMVSDTIYAVGSDARITGSSVGAYATYINGGFSTDLTYKIDFLNVNSTADGVSSLFGLTNYTTEFNVNKKIEMPGNWWIEPTAGFSDTATQWNGAAKALGLANGDDWRVRGGARFGWSGSYNNIPVEFTVGAYAYDDVSITGGTLASVVTPMVPTDQGLVFGQLVSKASFDWGKGLSSYVEAELRGSTNIFGVAGRAGARYQW
jgi:hypothetical protein